MTQSDQAIAQFIGTCLAAITGGWVAADAKRRGLKDWAAFGWGVGVFFILLVFLPLYLYLRHSQGWGVKNQPGAPGAAPATAECPYCGYANTPGANYCGKCDRQLKSASEIHSKGKE